MVPQKPEPEPPPVAGPVDLDQNLLDKTSRATAFIRVEQGNIAASGSGFIVKANGDTAYIITNFHVIDLDDEPEQPKAPVGKKGPKFGPPPMIGKKKGPGGPLGGRPATDPKTGPKVTVVLNSGTPDEQSLPAQIVAVDEEGDLAALRITGARNLPDALDVSQDTDVGEGQPVYIFGFPAKNRPKGPGNPPVNVGKGTISGLRYNANNDLTEVHVNGEINPGNSGGPVIDAQGRLVGVAVATVVGKQIGFAIPTGELLQMFKGRVSKAIVYQLTQQGNQVNALGEFWAHDPCEPCASAAWKNIAVLLPGDAPKEPKFPDDFNVVAILADPMLKIGAATSYFAVAENGPRRARRDGLGQARQGDADRAQVGKPGRPRHLQAPQGGRRGPDVRLPVLLRQRGQKGHLYAAAPGPFDVPEEHQVGQYEHCRHSQRRAPPLPRGDRARNPSGMRR